LPLGRNLDVTVHDRRNQMSATVQHPQPLHELAPGLALARGGPGRTLNIYLLGTVVVDSGVRWSSRRLARQLAGRQLTAHVLTHAHFDHAGSSAWLCHTLGVPLWCGAGDAAAIASGRVDSHGSPLVNRLQRTLAPVTAYPVSRTLEEGDLVAGFEVLEVPGHSRGALAFWRERDRVLVCGDVLANFGLHPRRPRLVLAPAALSSDYQQNRRSAARLAGLRPRLACFGHGFAVTDPGRFAAAVDQLLPSSP
jgi:glyoxylase-like metal-dependent hydrolase (beta-lactamase superfamily II)